MIPSYIECYDEERSGRSAFSYRTCVLCGRSGSRNIVLFVYIQTFAADSLFLFVGVWDILSRLRGDEGDDCFISRTYFVVCVVSSSCLLYSDYCRRIYDNTGFAQIRFPMDPWMEISSMVFIWCCYFNRLQFPHEKCASAHMGDYNVKMQFVTASMLCHRAVVRCGKNAERRERI